MTEKIELNATSEEYARYFPGARFSPPEALRSSVPGETVQIVHMHGAGVLDAEAVWGFVPQWRLHADNPIYYAAGATITKKWMCSVAFRNWRCIVPASSFAYLRKIDGVTMRYELSRTGGGLLLLAGIFEPSPPQSGGKAPTVALVTTTPNRKLAPHGLHVPLILSQKQIMSWLRCRKNPLAAKGLIRPPGADELRLTVSVEPTADIGNQVQADLELA